MTFYFAMTNSWSLLYDEIYGDDTMTDEKNQDLTEDIKITTNDDGITVVPPSANYDYITGVGTIHTTEMPTDYGIPLGCDDSLVSSININIPEEFQTPGIESNNPRKYKEDEAIKALQDYISTTYGGHYTSKENNVQTLDLIESVGDAESFCRSNAIKYLSRYDKKGQAKRDILKALHYSLLLYHFSGQLNETPTRGYETF